VASPAENPSSCVFNDLQDALTLKLETILVVDDNDVLLNIVVELV
jgi:hypothetical protein